MNFGFTEEQDLLRQEVRKFLDAHCPLEEVRKLMETPDGFSRALWKQLGELGWLGLTIPEKQGGAGLGWVDLVVVLEEMGATLFPSPFLATTIAAAAIREAGSDAQQARWLPSLADGSCIASLAFLEPSDRWDVAGVALAGRAQGGGVGALRREGAGARRDRRPIASWSRSATPARCRSRWSSATRRA